MRPTTSTTNKKTTGKSQILKTPFVSSPFRDQNSIQQFLHMARRFRGLTHSRYNFKWDRERRVKFGYSEILVLEKTSLQICYREGKKLIDWLSPPWLRMEQNLCQIMAGRSLFLLGMKLWTERREADLLIGNGKRIYETQVTKSRNAPLLIEVARCRYKGGSVNLRLRTRWPETEKLYDTLQLKLLEGRYANS